MIVETSEAGVTTSVMPAQPADGNQAETGKPQEQGAPGAQDVQGQPEKPEAPEKRESRFKRRLDHWKGQAAYWRGIAEAHGAREKPEERQAKQQDQGEPKREAFDSYEAYLEARADWRADKRSAESVDKRFREREERERREREDAEHRTLKERFEKTIEAAAAELPDFDEVMAEAEVPITSAMQRAIMESDIGARIGYYLAKNPDEAARIVNLSHTRQIAEIGKLEDKILAAKPAKKPSNAPDPINPVGGGGATVAKKPEEMTDAEYAEYRKKRKQRR